MKQSNITNINYLVIDQGNTLIKVYLFSDNEIKWVKIFKELNKIESEQIKHESGVVQNGIISSVSGAPEEIVTLFNSVNWLILDHTTPVPITNLYKTPQTLGKDRLAGVVAAAEMFPSRDILVIDAGTAITYDFINSKCEYIGGSISPGLSIRFKALNNFTGKLPLLEINESNTLTGHDTIESITSGVMNGAFFEIDGFINKYKDLHPNIITIFTGGDAKYFDKNVKSNIFVVPNLVAFGLKLILKYNLEK